MVECAVLFHPTKTKKLRDGIRRCKVFGRAYTWVMSNYIRYRIPGGCYFFTVNLLERNNTLLVDRGRTASYPTAPSRIPACGITAQGSSKLLALHTVLIILFLEIMTNSWLRYSKVFYQFVKPFPVIAFAL